MADQNTKIVFIWVNFGTYLGVYKFTYYKSREGGAQIRIRNGQKGPKGSTVKSIVRLVDKLKILNCVHARRLTCPLSLLAAKSSGFLTVTNSNMDSYCSRFVIDDLVKPQVPKFFQTKHFAKFHFGSP